MITRKWVVVMLIGILHQEAVSKLPESNVKNGRYIFRKRACIPTSTLANGNHGICEVITSTQGAAWVYRVILARNLFSATLV